MEYSILYYTEEIEGNDFHDKFSDSYKIVG